MNKVKAYISHKVNHLKGSPKQVAAGFALGSFMGVSPFIGMQIIISVTIAYFFKISKAASIVGVLNTNWTKGILIYPINYKIGMYLLHRPVTVNIKLLFEANALTNILHSGVEVFVALLIGGCVTGMLIALFYYIMIIKLLNNNNKIIQATSMGKSTEQYALITGASQGLGKAIAIELASRKINVLLVALKNEGLEELCSEIKENYNVDAQYFETDFKVMNSVYNVSAWALDNKKLFMLINNAGLGGTCEFADASPEYLDSIIQVNVRATSMLTRLLLPELKKREEAYILNVASMASFSPFAYKTVYPASKAFVYSFSRGLNEELKGSNVFVSVIHPGPIRTNQEVIKRIDKQGFWGKLGLLSVEKLANISVNQLLKRDSLILPGILNKINWLLMMLIPNAWKLPILSKVVRREIQESKPLQQAF